MNTKLLRLILVVFVSATALAACSFSGEVDVTVPPSNLSATTNWWLEHTDRPVEYVICDNMLSRVNTSFRVSSSSQVDRVVVQRVGDAQEISDTVTVPRGQLERDGNWVSFSMAFAPGTTPFSVTSADSNLDSQAIVIVPIDDPAARQGTLRLQYTIHMDSGRAYTFTGVSFPVWGGCETTA